METFVKILGGIPAERMEFTHHVALLEIDYYFCGGSLISSFFAISAAHCFQFGPYKPVVSHD